MEQAMRPVLAPVRHTAGSAGAVLVANFQPFARVPRIGELLAGRTGDLAVYEVDPAADLAAGTAYLPLDRIVTEYAKSFATAERTTQVTVVGYCSAATLALRIAAALAADRRVDVVLARPTWPDAALLGDALADIRAGLGGTTPPPGLDGDPAAVLAELDTLLATELRATATANGIDPARRTVTDLLGRYHGWLGYLLAARDALRTLWTADLAPVICADEGDTVRVPGFDPAGYRVHRYPIDEGATPKVAAQRLADAVLARLDHPVPGAEPA